MSQMQESMQKGSAVLSLIGEDGCGKTMMCRMLEHETPDGSKTIFFAQTVESYEDVIQILALELGLERPSEGGLSVGETLSRITDYLKAESLHLSIIFDEAENIYLATLERIRKMLDQIIAAGCSAHMVFAGRNNFIENCQQLTICEFQNDEELRFELTPFSEDATFEYLRLCSERLADQGHVGSFTDDIARKIHTISKGNVRMINILAEESLKNQGDDTSFMVLLDSVSEDVDLDGDDSKKGNVVELFSNYTSYLPWIGGLVFCGLILLFFLWPGEEVKTTDQQEFSDAQVAFIEKAPEVIYKDTEKPTRESSATDKSLEVPGPQHREKTVSAVETPQTPAPQVAVRLEETKQVSEAPETPEAYKVSEAAEIVSVAKNTEPVVTSVRETPSGEVAENQGQDQEQETAVADKEQPTTEKTIIQLRQIPPLKKSIAAPLVIAQTAIKVQPRTEVANVVIAKDTDTVDLVYQKRVLAGTVWESQSKNQMYTVQLMVLTSADAEVNLKRMLASDEYRTLANNFFIFQKGIKAEIIFVFYGEYETIDEARNAKDSFPESLREHQPYAIPIVDAVKKSQR